MKSLTLCTAFVLCAAACSQSIDAATEVGLTSNAVIGDVTQAFPEIGMFAGPAGPCTATLIGPQVILTAAHCFKHQDDLSESASVGWFMYNNFASQRMIKQYISLGGALGENDLAVAKLDQPISDSDGVVPRTLGREYPSDGNLYTTVIGYGCGEPKSSVLGAPYCDESGDYTIMRALDIAWWVLADHEISSNETGMLVVTVTGDSGGPVLDPNGSVIFTTSDSLCAGQVAPVTHCTESFGGVPQNRGRIINAIAQLGLSF